MKYTYFIFVYLRPIIFEIQQPEKLNFTECNFITIAHIYYKIFIRKNRKKDICDCIIS